MTTPRRQLLLVEDDADLRLFMEEMFVAAGYDVATASDGVEGTTVAESQRFDVIVTDFTMPRLNGLQFAANVRSGSLNCRTPLFVISGNFNGESLKLAAGLRVIKVLPKPIDNATLIETIGRQLDDADHVMSSDPQIIECVIQAMGELMMTYLNEKVSFGRLSLHDGLTTGLYVTAALQLSGPSHRGMVACSFARHVLERLGLVFFAGASAALSERLEADMAGELVNQLAARAKVPLARIGVAVDLGLPQVTLGMGHRLLHRIGAPIARIEYRISDQVGYLDCAFVKVARSSQAKGATGAD